MMESGSGISKSESDALPLINNAADRQILATPDKVRFFPYVDASDLRYP